MTSHDRTSQEVEASTVRDNRQDSDRLLKYRPQFPILEPDQLSYQ